MYLYLDVLSSAVTNVIRNDPISRTSRTKVPSSMVMRMYEAIGNLFVTCSSVMYNRVCAVKYLIEAFC